MIKMKKVQVEKEYIDYIICDKCGRKLDPEDFLEFQERLSIRFCGGYGSIFGDLNEMSCDLCQYCVKELLGDYLKKNVDEEEVD